MAARQEFASLQQEQQQEDQQQQQLLQSAEVPLKHRALLKEARQAFDPAAVLVDLSSVTITLHGLFEPGAAKLEQSGAVTIAKIAELARKYGDYELMVQGYTDSRGSVAHNARISRRRAVRVKALMVLNKVEAGRISMEGQGEALPVSDNTTAAGRALNRRVEVVFLK
jgi:outer membrane protein OmpA-like peptidoglycan-associated protein